MLDQVGIDPVPQRRPPATRVLRRPVPAHQHRPGPGAPAQAAGLRRDRLRPRRVGAGADPQPARGPQAGVRPDRPLHRPRPGRGEERERPGGRHVPRPALRDRAVGPPLRGAGPPLHGGAAGLGGRARPRGDRGRRSPWPASRRARSTRPRAAASAPAAPGPRRAAPRRSPRCASWRRATRWPATSPSALEPARRAGAGWRWPPRPAVPRPARGLAAAHRGAGRALGLGADDGGVERPRRATGRTTTWSWPTGPGTTSATSTSSCAGPRRSSAAGPDGQLPRHPALEPGQALPARARSGGRPGRADAWVEPTAAAAASSPAEGEVVVKPAISGGGHQTARYEPHEHDDGRGHIDDLRRLGRVAMVQPYQPAVDAEGEPAADLPRRGASATPSTRSR